MTTQVTFNNFNVGERKNGQIPAELITILVWKWIINSIVPNTYLEIHIPHPAQILKSRSCACFPQHQTIPPKRCQDWFLQMFHSPCPSQCTVATSSCKSSSPAIFWPCFLHFLSQSSATHNSMAIHQKIYTYPAHPRAACICQSLQCLVASKVRDEGQPWIALLSKSTFGPHLSPSSSTSPAPGGGKKIPSEKC